MPNSHLKFAYTASLNQPSPLGSQFVTSKKAKVPMFAERRGGRRHLPYAFTEQGVAMLSSVLRSKRAVLVNYDAQFKVVFDAIRELMSPPEPRKKRPIGFAPWGA